MVLNGSLVRGGEWAPTIGVGAGAPQEMAWSSFSVAKPYVHNVYMGRKSAKRWIIKGAVQGVGFRFFVQDTATSLGVTGWVRNLSDGSVEVYGVGPESRLNELAGALHIGPRAAEVRSVEQRDDSVENHAGFAVR